MSEPPEVFMTDAEAWIVALVRATQDAVITIDPDGRIDQFNAAAERMFGYTAEEIRGREVEVLMPEPYQHAHRGFIERYERTGEPHAIGRIRSVTAVRRNGEEFPAELSVTEARIRGGTRYGAFLRDISESTKLHDELVRKERLAAIGTTAAKFAHEVANPLNGMYTQAQLIKRWLGRDTVKDGRIVAGVETLLSDIERLNALLLEFRSMSRKQEYRFAATSIAELCEELCNSQRLTLEDRGVSLTVNLAKELPLVQADAAKLKQVLLNLFKNALEAMPNGGEIAVRAAVDDTVVEVKMVDGGVGIPDDFDAFAPFETTKAAGTGLGLPIVREIVQAHGGDVTYAAAPAGGTVFTLRLPIERG